jgi:GNAT superfamily N-acetyltransferase
MLTRPLTEADLPRAVALSAAVGWNQNEADWRVFLRDGAVRAMDDGDPVTLAATAAVLPLGPDLAWISMVLVRPDLRRRGMATQLMRWAVERLEGTRCVALDATPAGREVYRRLGFQDAFGFTRWRLPAGLPAPGLPVRRLRESDWPALLAFDREAFGAPREKLLRSFAERLPAACWITEDGSGYALGRDGLRLPQIGPVVATGPAIAVALVAAAARATGGTVLLDLADDAGDVIAILESAGAERLRGFTRMARGAAPPGLAERLIAMAGPEFG